MGRGGGRGGNGVAAAATAGGRGVAVDSSLLQAQRAGGAPSLALGDGFSQEAVVVVVVVVAIVPSLFAPLLLLLLLLLLPPSLHSTRLCGVTVGVRETVQEEEPKRNEGGGVGVCLSVSYVV